MSDLPVSGIFSWSFLSLYLSQTEAFPLCGVFRLAKLISDWLVYLTVNPLAPPLFLCVMGPVADKGGERVEGRRVKGPG